MDETPAPDVPNGQVATNPASGHPSYYRIKAVLDSLGKYNKLFQVLSMALKMGANPEKFFTFYAKNCKFEGNKGKYTFKLTPIAHSEWVEIEVSYDGCEHPEKVEVPIDWFHADFLRAIDQQVLIREERSDGKGKGKKKSYMDVGIPYARRAIGNREEIKGSLSRALFKMVILGRRWGHWKPLLESLAKRPNYRAICDIQTGFSVDPSSTYVAFFNEKHADNNLFSVGHPKNTLFARPVGKAVDASDVLNAFYASAYEIFGANANNVAARISRQSDITGKIKLGEFDILVVDDVPGPLRDSAAVGVVWVPREMLKRFGPARITDLLGIKGVIMQHPAGIAKKYRKFIIMSAGAFKAKVYGVIAGSSSKDPVEDPIGRKGMDEIARMVKETMPLDEETRRDPLALEQYYHKVDQAIHDALLKVAADNRKTGRIFRGQYISVGYWVMRTTIYATELYGAEKLRWTPKGLEYLKGLKFYDPDTSVYTWYVDRIKCGEPYPMMDLFDLYKEGKIEKIRSTVSMKNQEVSVLNWQYGNVKTKDKRGRTITQRIVDRMVYSSIFSGCTHPCDLWINYGHSPTENWAIDILSIQHGADVPTRVISEAEFEAFCDLLPDNINAGVLSVTDYGESHEDYERYWLSDETGHKDIDNALSTIANGDPRIIVVDLGKYGRFSFPSGLGMRKFVHRDVGAARAFLTKSAYAFLQLAIAYRNRDVIDWKQKRIDHAEQFQYDYLGKPLNNITVWGSGGFALLPLPTLKKHQMCSLNEDMEKFDGMVLPYSKMPVLFQMSMMGLRFLAKPPKGSFEDLNETDDDYELFRFAYRNVLFVNPEQLMENQNDTDGDRGRVFFTPKAVPLYQGVPRDMDLWVKRYLEDERNAVRMPNDFESLIIPVTDEMRDLLASKNRIKAKDVVTLPIAMNNTVQNKRNVGTGTNQLLLVDHLLFIAVEDDKLDFDVARRFRNVYSMALQAVIKERTGAAFFDAYVTDMLYAQEDEEKRKQVERNLFNLIRRHKMLSKNDNEIQILSDDEIREVIRVLKSFVSPEARARIAAHYAQDIRDVSTDPIHPDEFVFTELDMITRYFINSVRRAKPYFWMKAVGVLSNRKEDEGICPAYHRVMWNLDVWMKRYCLPRAGKRDELDTGSTYSMIRKIFRNYLNLRGQGLCVYVQTMEALLRVGGRYDSFGFADVMNPKFRKGIPRKVLEKACRRVWKGEDPGQVAKEAIRARTEKALERKRECADNSEQNLSGEEEGVIRYIKPQDSSFSMEDVEELLEDLDDKDRTIESLLREKEEWDRRKQSFLLAQEKVAVNLEKRFRVSYPSLRFNHRSLKKIARLSESELLKLEKQFFLLQHNPKTANFRDDIVGTDVRELGFGDGGRIYVRKEGPQFFVVCVGDKKSQNVDIKNLKREYKKS